MSSRWCRASGEGCPQAHQNSHEGPGVGGADILVGTEWAARRGRGRGDKNVNSVPTGQG